MNILFDLDGTLTDPFVGITSCIAHALTSMGVEPPDVADLRWCIGPPLRTSFAKLLDSDDAAMVEKAVLFYRDRFGTVGLYENEVYRDIPETLEALTAAGHRLFVATSKARVYAERIVDHFGLGRFFNGVYGSELDGSRSDKTSLLHHILRQEAISSAETLMIGDRMHDAIGAKANNIPCCGVLWGFGSREELQAHGAYRCVETPRELIGECNGHAYSSLLKS